jgi:hypothetical protein
MEKKPIIARTMNDLRRLLAMGVPKERILLMLDKEP